MGAHVWGNLFIKEGVIIVLKKGFIRNVYITPDEPYVFIEQLEHRLRSETKSAKKKGKGR